MDEETIQLSAQKTIPHKPTMTISAQPSRAKAESLSREKPRDGGSATVSARAEITALA
jgi:hypothetical protein